MDFVAKNYKRLESIKPYDLYERLIEKDLVKGKVLEIIMGDDNNEVIKLGEVPDNSNNIKKKKSCCWK